MKLQTGFYCLTRLCCVLLSFLYYALHHCCFQAQLTFSKLAGFKVKSKHYKKNVGRSGMGGGNFSAFSPIHSLTSNTVLGAKLTSHVLCKHSNGEQVSPVQ